MDFADDGTYFTVPRYRWKLVADGETRDATPEELGLMLESAHVGFVDGYPICTEWITDLTRVSGSFGVRPQSIPISRFRAPGMSIRDSSPNQYQFRYDVQG